MNYELTYHKSGLKNGGSGLTLLESGTPRLGLDLDEAGTIMSLI
jgi:hypothetical protein